MSGKSKKNKKPGVIKRISKNRDIKLGLLFLALALVFAFLSISQEIETSVDEGELNYSGKDYPYPLERKYNERNADLYLEYNVDNESDNKTRYAMIHFGNIDGDEFQEEFSRSIKENNNLTIDLDERDEFIKYIWANFTAGNIEYSLEVTYLVQPYSLLTFPAMIFTLAGVVFSMKGKSAILVGIGKEKKEDKMIKEMQSGDDEEMSRLEMSRREQGLQNRPEAKRKDIKFMGVDFKGQEEDEEE